MTEQVIGEDAGYHRLADGNGADADTGVVTAMGGDLDLVAVDIDGTQRIEDRTCRLDGKPGDDVLTSGDAAQDPARVVRQKDDPAVLHSHFVSVLLAGELCRSEPRTDLHTLHRVDRHQSAGKIAVELAARRSRRSQ